MYREVCVPDSGIREFFTPLGKCSAHWLSLFLSVALRMVTVKSGWALADRSASSDLPPVLGLGY